MVRVQLLAKLLKRKEKGKRKKAKEDARDRHRDAAIDEYSAFLLFPFAFQNRG
jgi:hypothetical protein